MVTKLFFSLILTLFAIQHSGGEFLRLDRTYVVNPAISSQITPQSNSGNGITAVVWNDNVGGGSYQVAYSLFNSTTTEYIGTNLVGYQKQTEHPAVASLSDRFVVVYSNGYTFLSAVYEVRFTIILHVNTTAIAQEVKVLNATADMRYPSVATLSTGHFIVSWEHNPQLLDLLGVLVLLNQFDVRVRVFNPDGTAASNFFAVTSNQISFKPRVTALDNNLFVSTWYFHGRIYARLLAFNDGAITALSNEFVALDSASNVIHDSITLGGTLWLVTAQSSTGLWARAFNGTIPLSDKWSLTRSISAASSSSTPFMGDGSIVFAWSDGTVIYGQQRSPTGAALSEPQVLINDTGVQVSNTYISSVSPWSVNLNWEASLNSRASVGGAFLSVRHCGDNYRDDGEQCDGGFGCYDNCTCPDGPQWAVVYPDATTIHCLCQEGYVPSESDCVVPTPNTPVIPLGEPPVDPNTPALPLGEPPVDPPLILNLALNSTAPASPSDEVSASVSFQDINKCLGVLIAVMHIEVIVLFLLVL